MEVFVPEGVSGGQTVSIQGPSGEMFNVQVPDALTAGASFKVAIPNQSSEATSLPSAVPLVTPVVASAPPPPSESQICCGFPADAVAARALHEGKRVDTSGFHGVRAIAALQVSIDHLYSIFSRRVDGIDLGGGNARLRGQGEEPADEDRGGRLLRLYGSAVLWCAPAAPHKQKGKRKGVRVVRRPRRFPRRAGGKPTDFQKEFWARRFARIAPVYYLSCLISLPLAYYQRQSIDGKPPPRPAAAAPCRPRILVASYAARRRLSVLVHTRAADCHGVARRGRGQGIRADGLGLVWAFDAAHALFHPDL
eukprot:2086561-Prymnesium_polylepis.1